MINIDLEGCQNVWFGTKEVDALYLADKLIWQRKAQEYVPNPETDFWFTTTTNTTIERRGSSTYNKNVKYSFDGYNWTQWNVGVELTINVGDTLFVSGTGNAMGGNGTFNYYFASSDTTPCLSIHGNLAALTNDTNVDYKYRAAFRDLKNLVDASELILPALTTACFQYMFQGCINLVYPPQLPATELVAYCYGYMFKGCTSLTTAPELPATILKQACYPNMFEGCTNLNYIKMLATDISASSCLNNWVSGVASTGTFVKHKDMTTLPTGISGIPKGWTVEDYVEQPLVDVSKALKFTAVDDSVNLGFANNTNVVLYTSTGFEEFQQWDGTAITIVPGGSLYVRGNNTTINSSSSTYSKFTTSGNGKLECEGNVMHLLGEDVTEITSKYCFSYMFYGCTSLTTAPELPATTLTDYCYRNMFNGCTSLTTAPELPATKIATGCYVYMFYGCTSLTTAPVLPATTLAISCYNNMFNGCTSLVNVPELPATTLVSSCYQYMFQGCTSLTTAPELPATTLVQGCYNNMFNGCNNLNYIKMLAIDISASNCLGGWVYGVASTGTLVKDKDMTTITTGTSGIPEGWTVENVFNEGKYLKFTAVDDSVDLGFENNTNVVLYTTNGVDDEQQWDGTAITIVPGGSLYVRGNNTTINSSSSTYSKFTTSGNGKLVCSGNIINLATSSSNYGGYTFAYLFYECTNIYDASELVLMTPNTNYMYSNMFNGCTSLVNVPELPATILKQGCYQYMFYGCTSLTTAPVLPATTLINYCYSYMFNGCTSLVNAPELPATTLMPYCYQYMFNGCTSLVNAPKLPATTLVQGCYYNMFRNCSALNYIKMLATDVSASYCLGSWVLGVASTGTFVKHYSVTLPVGNNGTPEGWEVKDNITLLNVKSLSITANDVTGNSTSTTIFWTAICEALTENGETIEVTLTGTDISEEFPQNTSTTDTVQRTISYTYMGVTATTTITQGVWSDKCYSVNLNDNWQLSSTIANPDESLYDGVYESFSNKGVGNSGATMYIDIFGCTNFTLYIRSYAEGNYDYVMVSQLDKDITYNTSYTDTTLVKAHTRGKQKSGTTINDYTKVEFTGIDEGEHRITIVYRKDVSGNTGDDRGYVLIPNNQ